MIMPILTVTDVDSSLAFFKDKLGFEHVMTMAPEGKSVFAIVKLGEHGDIGLGADEAAPKPPFAPGVQFMIYLPEGQSIDTFHANVKAKGVKIDDELTDTYWGDRAFSIHDPNGYWLTFAVTVKQVPVEEMEASVRAQEKM